ncbi:lipopolysaccharide biosynthesis protein [Shimwellia blattae]|uniref:Putative O-antigen transporter n=1 Tax=Shimwellia blattae (strain ATCC 29907 / DSM 4481 / JCM 1650 / NBRC 105725 / CDC 9005-74) TaxID=630626 RepID=I2B3Q0_SHIBC|nr:hypothetical protein [Shimwellia blattae]AFJ45154.1 hypothetical protein EBL_c00170 [Shimwellia blattae DSM 4481 = NBRC 105725]GAB82379.1 hypothetical protein EB105725_22_00770 [Shimwellia blattae DSM 4481 = NBRC 105725]
MNLLRSITTIASSSVISQLIGALSIWFISHRYGMAEVGIYSLVYSIVLVGAQVCMFASQLLIPRQPDAAQLARNVVFCALQSMVVAVPWAVLTGWIFHLPVWLLYLLSFANAMVLVAENLALREGNYRFLTFQRIMVSVIVIASVLAAPGSGWFYVSWTVLLLLLIAWCIARTFDLRTVRASYFTPGNNLAFFREHRQHLFKVGSAEVLAMVNNNLPIMLVNFWFSALVAGYFSVVMRFCLSPVMIIGNAVRNSIFSKWSMDFRNHTFNYPEYKKIRLLLVVMGVVCTLGILIFYPLVMHLGFSKEWIDSIPSSRYLAPYIFPALAISPLTVVELIFGSHRYFLRIQIEQLAIVLLGFLVVPWLGHSYALALLTYSVLTLIRYMFILLQMNKRAALLSEQMVRI